MAFLWAGLGRSIADLSKFFLSAFTSDIRFAKVSIYLRKVSKVHMRGPSDPSLVYKYLFFYQQKNLKIEVEY